MTKRLKVYLLIVFAAACLACTLVGCKIGRPGKAELLAGYDSHITYYSNGGLFNDSTTMSVIDIYYKAGDGVPFFNITEKTAKYGMKVERRGYDLAGWYEPEYYTADDDEKYAEYIGQIKFEITYTPGANGSISDTTTNDTVTEPVFPVKDENGKVITDNESDRPMYARMGADGKLKDETITEDRITVKFKDEESKMVAGFDADSNEINNLTVERDVVTAVCAKWELKASISYHIIVTDETGKVLTDADGKNPTYYNVTEEDDDGNEKVIARYKNGDEIALRPMHGDSVTPLDMELVHLDGLSFVRTYMDEGLTEQVYSIPKPTESNAPPRVVYCRYIVGDWTVISNSTSSSLRASQIKSMFNTLWNPNNKFLILDDINCEGYENLSLKVSGQSTAYARATIITDGAAPKTISNLSFEISGSVGNAQTYSIFGAIEGQFKVGGAGLILKDIKISLPLTPRNFNFYAICTSVADETAAANVDLTIDTVTVTHQCDSDKINNGSLEGDSWLLGGNAPQFTGIKLAGTHSISKEQSTT